jgi:dolichol-phosphate mannosyltransferase
MVDGKREISRRKRTRLSIVIPCYNEEEGIPNLAKQLKPVLAKLTRGYDLEPIFVDDGSKDNTSQLLHNYFGKLKNVKIIKHERNKNLGAALKTGFSQATGDLIAAWDSDCTYPPHLLPEMLKLLDNKTAMVTVSPYHPKGKVENVPFHRIFLSKGISIVYGILLNSGIYTHGAMVRVYRKEVIETVRFKADDFLSVSEIMVESCLRRYKVKELPCSLKVREYGTSKMKLAKTIGSHLNLIGRIMLYHIYGRRI